MLKDDSTSPLRKYGEPDSQPGYPPIKLPQPEEPTKETGQDK